MPQRGAKDVTAIFSIARYLLKPNLVLATWAMAFPVKNQVPVLLFLETLLICRMRRPKLAFKPSHSRLLVSAG